MRYLLTALVLLSGCAQQQGPSNCYGDGAFDRFVAAQRDITLSIKTKVSQMPCSELRMPARREDIAAAWVRVHSNVETFRLLASSMSFCATRDREAELEALVHDAAETTLALQVRAGDCDR